MCLVDWVYLVGCGCVLLAGVYLVGCGCVLLVVGVSCWLWVYLVGCVCILLVVGVSCWLWVCLVEPSVLIDYGFMLFVGVSRIMSLHERMAKQNLNLDANFISKLTRVNLFGKYLSSYAE